MKSLALAVAALLATTAPAAAQTYDVLVRGGTVYDGSDTPGRKVDVAIDETRYRATKNH